MPIPFTFNEELHICHDLHGQFIPSCTQVLDAQCLSFNFRKYVKPDLLDRRNKIGKEVHAFTDIFDAHSSIDPTWMTSDTAGFFESWIGLRRLSGFVPQRWSVRRCELVNGLAVTGETDKEGFIGKHSCIIDLKTGASSSDSWGVQLASYELLKYQSVRVGRELRFVAQLNADGSPGQLIEFGEVSKVDGTSYAQTFLAALHCTHWALKRNYISERDFIAA